MMTRSLLGFCGPVVGALFSVLVLSSAAIAAGDANIAACANESSPGFREYLPDCRAYELVSPPFKDGARISLRAVSANGSSVLGESNGAFAGTETGADGIEGTLYEFSRSGSGWVVSALSPPASLFPSNTPFASSTDLARTLWGMRRSSQSIYAENLYVREPDGSFVEIGPMVPPSAEAGPPAGGSQVSISQVVYQGASSDLSHVLFQIKGDEAPFWPGDTTEKGPAGALYEYVGTENKKPPELVGLNGEDHLISNCGTVLGGTDLGGEASVDAYNAVSSDGESVFFTSLGHNVGGCEVAAPEVSEVYARLGQDETVAISEPSPGQCRECDTTSRAPAEFQGASKDGSKVFFLTEQELFSGDTTMNLYEYDFDNPNGQKIVRVSGGSSAPEVQGVARVSEDGSHVYFVAKGVLASRNAEGKEPEAGKNNLYVFERDAQFPAGHTQFVADLCSNASASGSVPDARCPSSLNGTAGGANDLALFSGLEARGADVTPDGRFLIFPSYGDLTPDDTSSARQVFEYDALTGSLVRVSVGQNGFNDDGNTAVQNATIRSPNYEFSDLPGSYWSSLTVSADGSFVFFESGDGLTPQALNDVTFGVNEFGETHYMQNVYEYHEGNVSLISDGQDIGHNILGESLVHLDGTDESGRDVFFETEDGLVPQDTNGHVDVYDARVDGGFPSPPAPPACSGDACQGALSSPPTLLSPGSEFQAGGNPPLAVSEPAAVSRPKALTAAQKLADALKACKKDKSKKQRTRCAKQARRKYATTKQAKKSTHGKGSE